MNVYPLPAYHIDRTLHGLHDLLYIMDGEWGVIQDGINYPLKSGDAILLRERSHHTGSTLSSPYMRAFYVHFEVLPSDRYNVELTLEELEDHAQGNIACIPTVTECGKNEEVARLMKELNNIYFSVRPDKQRLLSMLLTQLLNELANAAFKAPPYQEEWIVKILRMFRSDNKRMYSLQELADIAQLSVRTLGNKFKKITGQTPYQYQLNIKLDTAKQQLSTTNQTIQEIASNLGFCDAYQFSRMFKKRFGLSPANYRRTVLHTHINSKDFPY